MTVVIVMSMNKNFNTVPYGEKRTANLFTENSHIMEV